MFHFQQNLQKCSIENSYLYRVHNMYKIQKGFVKFRGYNCTLKPMNEKA
jgi:hypothetical protein